MSRIGSGRRRSTIRTTKPPRISAVDSAISVIFWRVRLSSSVMRESDMVPEAHHKGTKRQRRS
jgi:hypothetical protein